MKRQPTKEEKAHMEAVRALGCVVGIRFGRQDCCAKIEVHHITGAGMGLRASHYETIPLCFNHHSAQTPLRFGNAVHKGTESFEKRYGSQQYLLKVVRAMLTRREIQY